MQNYIDDAMVSFDPASDYIANWFDTEFNQYLKLDIYEHSLDAKQGYITLKVAPYNIVIITLPKLEAQISTALTEVLGRKINVEIGKENTRSSKAGADIYSRIKKKIVFDRSYLEQVYSTKFATHFFDEETRKSKIAYWSTPRE